MRTVIRRAWARFDASRTAAVVFPIVGLCAAAAIWLLTGRVEVWITRALMALAAFCGLMSWPQPAPVHGESIVESTTRAPRRLLARFGVVLLAASVLFVALSSAPWVISSAEAQFGLEARGLLGHDVTADGAAHETSIAHVLSALAMWFGLAPLLAIRLASALLTFVLLLGVYRLVAIWRDEGTATLATLLVLLSWQVLVYGRLGTSTVSLAVLTVLTLLLIEHLARTRSRAMLLFFGAGLLISVALFALAVAGPVSVLRVPSRDVGEILRGDATGDLIWFGPITVSLLPLALGSLLSREQRTFGLRLGLWLLASAILIVAGQPAPQTQFLLVVPLLVAVAAVLMRAARSLRTILFPAQITVAAVVLVLIIADENISRAQAFHASADAGESAISEVARFLGGLDGVQDIYVPAVDIPPASHHVEFLVPNSRVVRWNGSTSLLPALEGTAFVVGTRQGRRAVQRLAAITGQPAITYGRQPSTFSGLLLAPRQVAADVSTVDNSPAPIPLIGSDVFASASPGHNTAQVVLALDGDPSTRWTSGRPQAGGEWFQIALPFVSTISALSLDTALSPDDFARGLEVLSSMDGTRFERVSVPSELAAVTTIRFDPPVVTRFLRLVQKGSADRNFWSIHELDVTGIMMVPPAWQEADRTSIVASSSSGSERARLALDGDPQTRWDSGAPQSGVEWFQLELPRAAKVGELRIDTVASPDDHPRVLEVSVSSDGRTFRTAATASGAPMTRVVLDPPVAARVVRLQQTGRDPFNFWSIHEVSLWGEFEHASRAPELRRERPTTAARAVTFDPDPLRVRVSATDALASSEPVPASMLRASSSRPTGKHLLANALDNNAQTRWDSGLPQAGGEWFQVDLPEPAVLTQVQLDTSASPDDYPRRLLVSVSADGRLFEPIASVDAPAATTTVKFEPPVRGRSVRLEQTGAHPVFFWSIHELALFGHVPAQPASRFAGLLQTRWLTLVALLIVATAVIALPYGVRHYAGAAVWSIPSHDRKRIVVVALAGALLVITAVRVAQGDYGVTPFGAWIVAMGLGWRALRTKETTKPLAFDRRDAIVLFVLLVLATFFRLHRLDQQPSGLWIDEIAIARNAVALAEEQPFTPFGATPLQHPDWVKTSNLYLYFSWVVVWVSGYTEYGIKLISVLPGIAAVPLLYLLARRFLSIPAAAVAAGFLAVSLWHVTLSRWGWDEVLATALAIAGFARLHDAIRSGASPTYAVAGVIFGLSLYGYIAARLVLAAALLVLISRIFIDRHARPVRGLAMFVCGAVAAALPLAIYWMVNPQTFMVRVNDLSIAGQVLAGDPAPLVTSLKAHLLMFHLSGDTNPRHNLPGLPMLDPLVGILFIVGIAVAVGRWQRPEHAIALCWLAIGLLGGILSDPSEAPQAYRTGLVAPACYLLAAIGFERITSMMSVAASPTRRALTVVVALTLVSISAAWTYDNYFEKRAECVECWGSVYESADAAVITRTLKPLVENGTGIIVDEQLGSAAMHLEIDLLLPRQFRGASLQWRDATQVEPADLNRAVLVVSSARWTTLPDALKQLAGQPVVDPFGRSIAVLISR